MPLRVEMLPCTASGPAQLEPSARSETVEDLEAQAKGSWSAAKVSAEIQLWRKLMWCWVVPEAALLIAVPAVAPLPRGDAGLAYFETLNFFWCIWPMFGFFLCSQLGASFCHAVCVAHEHLLSKKRVGARDAADDPADVAAAVAAAGRPSRLEVVLTLLGIAYHVEITVLVVLATLNAQRRMGTVLTTAWVKSCIGQAFLLFLSGIFPFVLRSISVGLVRREKSRIIEYVKFRWYASVAPVMMLQLYIMVYTVVTLGNRLPITDYGIFAFLGSDKHRLCEHLESLSCTVHFGGEEDDVHLLQTPLRPDSLSCNGTRHDSLGPYGSRYEACVSAGIGEDLVVRGFAASAASLTAVIVASNLELLHLLRPCRSAPSPLWPPNLLRSSADGGFSWRVKLASTVLCCDAILIFVHLVIAGIVGIGSDLYPSGFWALLVCFGVPKVVVTLNLLLEFSRRSGSLDSDMFTKREDGRAVSVRETVARSLETAVEAQAKEEAVGRFAGEATQLVTGKPKDAALGVNFYMRVDKLEFAMPSYSKGVAAIAAEFEASGTACDRECLHYCLTMRAGSSDLAFDNGDLKRDCDARGELLPSRRAADGGGMRLDDFMRHPAARTAELQLPHVLALRLYTTAAFRSLNSPLRDTSPDRRPHAFPITVNFIREAISMLRAVEAESERATATVDLWRGLKNVEAASGFLESGGTELAPMSTTTSIGVAMSYSLSPCSLLLKVRTVSFIDRGADLAWLSAFPAEAEVLFPPLTFLQPTGRTLKVEREGWKVVVVEVEPRQ